MIAAERCVGQSRVELYLSLSVFPIDIPPLRDRVDDIAPLVRLILERLGVASWVAERQLHLPINDN